jgi:hypothetical protein
MGISRRDAPIGPLPSSGKTIYQEQEFKADVGIKSREDAREPWIVELSNIREVKAITFADGDAGAIATATYETFDITAVQIGLRMGANVSIQVKPRDGTVLTYKVRSVHEDLITEPGATGDKRCVIINAWAIRDLFPIDPPFSATFVDATVSVTILPALNQFSLSHWECRNDFRNDLCLPIFLNYNSNSETGKLTISDVSNGETPATPGILANNDLIAFLVNLSGLMRGKGLAVEIRAKRAGCNNVKTMIGIVDRICVDGKRIELRISKKGLKSKGCAAKKAVAGFTSDVAYELQSIKPVFGPVGEAGSSNPGDWPVIGPAYWAIAGTLTKTGVVGEFRLRFALDAKTRVFSYDEEKNEVSSISVNDYLVQVAQSIGRVPPLAGVAAPARFETAADRPGAGPGPGFGIDLLALVGFEPAGDRPGAGAGGGQIIAGLISGLVWSTEKSSWSAKVKTSFVDAAKLGDETRVDKFRLNDYCERRPNDPICQEWGW